MVRYINDLDRGNTEVGDLRDYFEANSGRLIDKWVHYFDIYERHFERFRGQEVHVLEIGVYQGGSLQMWKHYFGKQAHIHGIDINPNCKSLQEDQITIHIGDQGDPAFWSAFRQSVPTLDVVIDDGGHFMTQQITTFESLFPVISQTGTYLVEDLHTSYWPEFGGGLHKSDTFIEYSKNLIDYLNAWHSKDERFQVNGFSKSAWSMTYYDSVLVIDKKPKEPPYSKQIGVYTPL